VPAPKDILAAFAQWTSDHYGPDFGSSCYYYTQCLTDKSYSAQWPNQRTWGEWQRLHPVI
jgi:hypothetical protein